jgi:hypothetical protein
MSQSTFAFHDAMFIHAVSEAKYNTTQSQPKGKKKTGAMDVD